MVKTTGISTSPISRTVQTLAVGQRQIRPSSACLKGQARAFYLGLSPLDRSSYHRLVQKISERFGSVCQQSRYLTKFETRNRGQGETIASLGDDLRLLAQRAYPELGTDAQESLALHKFYKAVL